MRQRQDAQRANRVHEQRVRAVERVDEAAVRQPRPAPGLHGAAHLAARARRGAAPIPSASNRPSRASRHSAPYVLTVLNPWSWTPMWVRCGVMWASVRARPISRKARIAGRIELQQRGSELKPLRPVGPPARLVLALDGEDRARQTTGPSADRARRSCRRTGRTAGRRAGRDRRAVRWRSIVIIGDSVHRNAGAPRPRRSLSPELQRRAGADRSQPRRTSVSCDPPAVRPPA